MSTKTTFKRIALVAVAALGFGVLSTVSASAAPTYTDTFSVDKTSITVVTNGTAANEITNGAIFRISLGNDGTDEDWTLATGETLDATVVGVPTGDSSTAKSLAANAADLTLSWVSYSTANGNPYGSAASNIASTANAGYATQRTAGVTTYYNSGSSTKLVNSQYLRVVPAVADAINQGTYTIRVRLMSNSGSLVVKDQLLKVTMVSSAASSGAVLTVTNTGSFAAAGALTAYNALNNIKITIADANGGRVVQEDSAGTTTAPSITTDLVDVDGALLVASGQFTAFDDASDSDSGYSTTAGVTDAILKNGTYGVDITSSALPTTAIGTTNKVRARYGASSASSAITVISAASTGGNVTGVSVSATGLSLLTAAPTVTSNVAAAATWYVPLTTTSASIVYSGGTAGNSYTYTVAYTGVASGDQTPLAATPTVVYADSSGKVTVSVKSANPIDGATAAVTIAGFATAQTNTQTIAWVKSKAATISVSTNGAVVALKSTNVITATVLDHFGAVVSGVAMTPVVSGANADLATAPRATVVSGTDGTASISLTDAAAVAADTDTITFNTVATGTPVTKFSTIKYAATAPAVTALSAYYSRSAATDGASAAASAAITTPVPTTSIYADSANVKFALVPARDNTKITTVANVTVTTGVASGDQLVIRVTAGAEGAPIVATASTGAYILNSSKFQKSSSTQYTAPVTFDNYFIVGSNVAGTNTITFTSGTVTTSVSFVTGTTAANARFVTLTGAAAGVANGDAIPLTAKVTDRYGNAVSGATLTIAATGVGVMLGGSTIQSYTTDSTGTFTFQGTSLAANGGTGTFTVTATNTADYASTAGKVGSTSVESTLAAGNSSAKVDVVFAAGNSVTLDAAQAASDAAAEATDAANAATDAANAAAEAADAATAAAQDAADAVAALSTQVSEMVNALKKQITALTNLVIKIQKKVKA